MRFNHVLFDLDGTLTNSAPGIENAVSLALDHFGIPYESKDDLSVFVGPPLRYIFPKWGVPEDQVEEAIRIYRAYYLTQGKFENEPYEGITDMLGDLQAAGVHLYVATSKPEETAREILDHFDLTKYFDEIAGATLDGSRDDKESVIRYLLGKAEHVSDALMVGDTVYDIEGAKKAGMASAGVAWGFGNVNDMIYQGASVIVENPEQLRDFILG
jgi:phosphoglycolate phosphatase